MDHVFELARQSTNASVTLIGVEKAVKPLVLVSALELIRMVAIQIWAQKSLSMAACPMEAALI
jgi:hypothetical protein